MRIRTALLCPPISLLMASTAEAFVPSTLPMKGNQISHQYGRVASKWTDLTHILSPMSVTRIPFLHFEQTSLDVDIHNFHVLEGRLVGPSAAHLCPSQDALREEPVFAWENAGQRHTG